MSRSIGALVLVFLCVAWLSADPQSAITGQIKDSGGAVLANARVLFHWDSSGSKVGLTDNIGTPEDVSVMTDANGNYSVSVPAGFYDVFVSAIAFTPHAAKVRVKQGQRTAFSTKLRADPLVTRELGDEIYGVPKHR